MNKTTVITGTTTVPADSPIRSLAMVMGRPVPATDPANPVPSNPDNKLVATPAPKLQLLQYAAAVLKGQDHMLEFFEDVFVSNDARIKKNEQGWILESSEFSS